MASPAAPGCFPLLANAVTTVASTWGVFWSSVTWLAAGSLLRSNQRPSERYLSGAEVGRGMGKVAKERADDPHQRVAELEDGLMRISDEIEELGLGLGLGDEVPSDSRSTSLMASADLTPRQQEVVLRLLDGERVPAISNAIFLSQSTVRNHLLAVFRKFDVHSQEELIGKLTRGQPG